MRRHFGVLSLRNWDRETKDDLEGVGLSCAAFAFVAEAQRARGGGAGGRGADAIARPLEVPVRAATGDALSADVENWTLACAHGVPARASAEFCHGGGSASSIAVAHLGCEL